jgi:hypothetical protein
MRALRLLLTWLALCVVSPWPLCATPTPTFAISSPSAPAGQPEVFTISRVSGGSGAYVLFQTYDRTAHAGTDYTATNQLIYVKSGVASVTVSVPTTVNPNATGTLTFIAAIASTTTASTGTASIVEPVSTPAPQPTGTWGSAPLAVGGYACNATQLADAKTPACGMGIVYKITGTGCNGIGTGTIGAPCANPVYLTQFFSDASKQFRASDTFDTSFVAVWAPEQLQGLAPTSP